MYRISPGVTRLRNIDANLLVRTGMRMLPSDTKGLIRRDDLRKESVIATHRILNTGLLHADMRYAKRYPDSFLSRSLP